MKSNIIILDNEDLQEIWLGAEVMDLSISETSTATKYAVEDGTTKSDHIIKNQTSVSLSLSLSDDMVLAFDEISNTYNSKKLVTIQTRTSVYKDLVVIEIPQVQDKSLLETANVNVRLVEWEEVKPEYGELTPQKVARKEQSSTVRAGTQATAEVPKKKGSVLSKLFS